MNPHPHPPGELAPLLVAVGRAGIELAPHPTDAGRLRHRPAYLPPDLSARLRIYRAAVVGLFGGLSPSQYFKRFSNSAVSGSLMSRSEDSACAANAASRSVPSRLLNG